MARLLWRFNRVAHNSPYCFLVSYDLLVIVYQ